MLKYHVIITVLISTLYSLHIDKHFNNLNTGPSVDDTSKIWQTAISVKDKNDIYIFFKLTFQHPRCICINLKTRK